MLVINTEQMQQQQLMNEIDFIQWYSDDYMPETLPDIAQAFYNAVEVANFRVVFVFYFDGYGLVYAGIRLNVGVTTGKDGFWIHLDRRVFFEV